MSRGNRRAAIFLDDVDRQDFLKTLAEACQKTSWQIHAYCLMSNHYHLVLKTPNANLVAGMAWLQSTYTIRLNQRHKLKKVSVNDNVHFLNPTCSRYDIIID
jgi:REP element-mobilizing transposase RayT